MPEVKMNGTELNDHVNENPVTERRPLTECSHEVPYGPATGKEDPRAHDPAPSGGKGEWQGNAAPPHSCDQDPEHGPGVK